MPVGSVSITIVDAKLLAGNIDIRAEISKDNLIRADDLVNAYADPVADWLPVGSDRLTELAEGLGDDAQQLVERLGLEEMPQFISATSTIAISGSKLIGQGRIDVQSLATTQVDLAPENGTLSLAVAATNTVARTIVQDSVLYTWGYEPASGSISTEGTVSVGSTAREVHNLVATSNVVDDGSDNPRSTSPSRCPPAARWPRRSSTGFRRRTSGRTGWPRIPKASPPSDTRSCGAPTAFR